MRRSHSLLAMLVLGLLLALPLAACNLNKNATQGVSVQVTVAQDKSGATLVLLPVTIEGKGPFTFALDTGASTSLIDAALAEQLGLPQSGSPQQISGIGGVQQATPVQVKDWDVGKIHLPKAVIASADLPFERRGSGLQGLVGSDIWSQFGTFTLDYRTSTLTVPRQISDAPGPPQLTGSFQMPALPVLPHRSSE